MPNDLAIQTQPLSVGGMLQAVMDGGVTSDKVDTFAKLVDLYVREQARIAEQEFAQAFVALQSEIPKIKAVSIVPGKEGKEKYRFAPYEEIMKQVQPKLTEHGFTVSFDTRTEAPRITVICTLTHKAGHSRKNELAVQIGGGPPGCSPTQADGAAKTYAKRNALSDALNIVTGVDTDGADDAKLLGPPIDDLAAEVLESRVNEVGANPESFLAWLGVNSFHHVPMSRLEEAHEKLNTKERLKNKA